MSLKAVLEVSLLFAQERDLHKLLQLVVEKAIETAAAQRGCIALGTADMLTPQAAIGMDVREGQQISSSIARDVLARGTARMWEDLAGDPLGEAKSVLRQQLASAMCAPLLVGGKVLGILYVDSQATRSYTRADLEVFQALASQAAIAIQNAQLFQEVITDPLTGLYSAAIFYRRLSEECDEHNRYGRAVSLILADLDDLKHINDIHGHAAGNRALLALAGVLRINMRRADLPCRYGGDEFAIIAPDTSPQAAANLKARLEAACDKISLPGWQGVSFGVSTCPDDGTDANEVFAQADRRTYEVKHARKARR